jgi:hypothetical protein
MPSRTRTCGGATGLDREFSLTLPINVFFLSISRTDHEVQRATNHCTRHSSGNQDHGEWRCKHWHSRIEQLPVSDDSLTEMNRCAEDTSRLCFRKYIQPLKFRYFLPEHNPPPQQQFSEKRRLAANRETDKSTGHSTVSGRDAVFSSSTSQRSCL